jgi:glycine C-acetyltransferase
VFVFVQLLGTEDAIISDELNHASIIDGIRLCKAKKFKYAHRNMKGELPYYWPRPTAYRRY